jgi:hypothetical protein
MAKAAAAESTNPNDYEPNQMNLFEQQVEHVQVGSFPLKDVYAFLHLIPTFFASFSFIPRPLAVAFTSRKATT